jgi:hypothetical protein
MPETATMETANTPLDANMSNAKPPIPEGLDGDAKRLQLLYY